MKSKKSLDRLLNSTRQYHARALLEPNEFISLFNDTLSELQITKKIDTQRLEDEIHNYLNILDWFGHVSTKITQNFYDKGLDIDVIDKDGSKAQHRTHSDEFVNYIITEHIKERHKKKFGSAMPELHSHQGIKLSDIQGGWHTVTQDNGITLTVETVVSSLIEYERSYLSHLASRGTLPALQNIQKIFSNVSYSNTTEAIIIQILEQCTELYLMQYDISSTLLPFHLRDEGISSNIDRIYEIYSTGKDQMVRKIMGMISAIEQTSISKDSERTVKELKRLAGDVVTESMVDGWEHPEVTVQEPNKEHTTERKRSGVEVVEPIKAVDVPNTQTVEPPKKAEALDAVKSEPQSVKITQEPVPAPVENEDTTTVLSVEAILDTYCAEKISDDEYKVVGDFYTMKVDGRFVLNKLTGQKKVGKGENVYEEPQYKLVSRKPFFVIENTHHIEDEIIGVRIASIDDIKNNVYMSFNLGELGDKAFLTKLNNKGYKIIDKNLAAEYVNLLEEKTEKQIFISNKVGWIHHQGQFGFVLPNGKGIGITGLEYDGNIEKLRYAIETKGDLHKWLSIFDKLDLERAHPRISFLLFASLLPLFAIDDDIFEGFTINITPNSSERTTSSNGKTTVQQLMLSIQGSVPKWHTNWNKTPVAIEQYLHTNVGAYFDDTSKARKDLDVQKLIFDVSDKDSGGTARGERERITVLFSTGEKDFLANATRDGAYVRYVDIGIKTNDYGSDSSSETAKIVQYIKRTVASNYGFVYPEAIRIFLDNKDALREKSYEYTDNMSIEGRYDNNERLAQRYAMIAVCGEVFIEVMRKLTGDKKLYTNLDPYQISLDMFKIHDARLYEMEKSKEEASDSLLDDFINQFKPDEDGNLVDNNGNKLGYIKGDQIRIIKDKAVITDYLPQGCTISDLDEAAKSSDRYVEVKSNNFTRKSILGKKQYRYFVFSKNT